MHQLYRPIVVALRRHTAVLPHTTNVSSTTGDSVVDQQWESDLETEALLFASRGRCPRGTYKSGTRGTCSTCFSRRTCSTCISRRACSTCISRRACSTCGTCSIILSTKRYRIDLFDQGWPEDGQ